MGQIVFPFARKQSMRTGMHKRRSPPLSCLRPLPLTSYPSPMRAQNGGAKWGGAQTAFARTLPTLVAAHPCLRLSSWCAHLPSLLSCASLLFIITPPPPLSVLPVGFPQSPSGKCAPCFHACCSCFVKKYILTGKCKCDMFGRLTFSSGAEVPLRIKRRNLGHDLKSTKGRIQVNG